MIKNTLPNSSNVSESLTNNLNNWKALKVKCKQLVRICQTFHNFFSKDFVLSDQ